MTGDNSKAGGNLKKVIWGDEFELPQALTCGLNGSIYLSMNEKEKISAKCSTGKSSTNK
jgi:hypothetical protein